MNKLILLGGMPASGKTTLGKKLSSHYSLPFLDKDTLCDLYTNYVVKEKTFDGDRSSALYKNILRPLEYQILWKVSLEQVSLGLTPIVVAPFSSEFPSKLKLEELRETLKKTNPNTALVTILLAIDEDSVKNNMVLRNRTEDQDKISQWSSYFQEKLTQQDQSRENVDLVLEANDPLLWDKITSYFNSIGIS